MKLHDYKHRPQSELVCERQTITLPNEFIFKFGYSGSCPDCFHAFLQEAGFKVTEEQIASVKEGDVLKS